MKAFASWVAICYGIILFGLFVEERKTKWSSLLIGKMVVSKFKYSDHNYAARSGNTKN